MSCIRLIGICGSQGISDKANILMSTLLGIKLINMYQLLYSLKFNCLLLLYNLKYKVVFCQFMMFTMLDMFSFIKIK